MAEEAYPTGYLAWGNLPRWTGMKDHPSCFRCQQPFRGAPTQKFCRSCMGTPEHTQYLRDSQRASVRNWRRRKVRTDPAFLEDVREKYRRRYHSDPEFRAKRLALSRERRRKKRAKDKGDDRARNTD